MLKEFYCTRRRISTHELPVKSRMCVAALKQKKRQGIVPCNLSGTAEFFRLIFLVRRFLFYMEE